MPEQPLEPELSDLERSLIQLEPVAHLQRDRLFFQAGRAASGMRWLWPASTVFSTLVAGILGWLLWQQVLVGPSTETPHHIVFVDRFVQVPVAAEPSPPVLPEVPQTPGAESDRSTQDYLRLRKNVVRWGADVLHSPAPQTTTEEPLTPADAPRFSPPPVWQDIFRFIPLPIGGDS